MKNQNNNGLFISIEGPDGSGKTTLVELLKKEINSDFNNKYEFIFTREPGGTNVSEKIRAILANDEMDTKTEALLFAASRAEHVSKLILPSLKENKVVICDRYLHSSLAFQGSFKKLGVKEVLDINNFGINKLYPQVVFYIDVPVEVLYDRLNNRKDKIDRLDIVDFDHIKKINDSYNQTLNLLENVNVVKINGNQKPEEIKNDIISYLKNVL